MERVLRGRLLRFLSEPQGPWDLASYTYSEDGAILVRDGLVVASGPVWEPKCALLVARSGAGDSVPLVQDSRVFTAPAASPVGKLVCVQVQGATT